MKYTGKDMVVKFGTNNVAGSGRQLEVTQSANEIDVTTYGSAAQEFIAGLIDRSATLEILDDSASSTIRDAFTPGSAASLTWFPTGTASGLPKLSCASAVVTEANIAYPYDDVVTISVSMRLSGAVLEGSAP